MEQREHLFPCMAAAVLTAACNAQADVARVTWRDSSGVTIVTNAVPERLKQCVVGEGGDAAESNSGYDLYNVTHAFIVNDKVVIANDGFSEIVITERDGTLVRKFGRAGNGPGEFRNISRVALIEPDTLAVEDYRPWRVQYFTFEGIYIRQFPLTQSVVNPPRYSGVMANGDIVAAFERRPAKAANPISGGWT